MACKVIHSSWTFTSLIAAFLDLSITYLLLCASTLAFFTSKFLSIFNLNLPCPCNNGLFSNPSNPPRNCLQRYLIDSPIKQISSVRKSITSKFPFDSILMDDHKGNMIGRLIENKDRHRFDELMDGESVQKRNELVRFGSLNSGFVVKGFDDSKGKGFSNQKGRNGMLRRRRGNPNRLVRRVSGFGSGRIGQEIVQNDVSSVSTYSEGDDNSKNDNKAQVSVNSDEGLQHSFRWNELNGESKNSERDESSASDVVRDDQHEMSLGQSGQSDGNAIRVLEQAFEDVVRDDKDEMPLGRSGQSDENAIRVLEQALEEEHAARAALYQELEKERSAAASAADEAMAMILRLQKEKASTEMEARQYQRMIEEKSAYDQEEMNILKEILLRREKEKHFLEKEVEAYRQIINPEKEEFAGMSVQRPRMSFDSSDDPALMLRQLSEYIDKKKMVENMKNASDYDPLPVEKYGRVLDFGDEYPSSSWYEIDKYLKQEEDRSLGIEKHTSASDIRGQISEAHSGFPKMSGSSEYQEHILFEKDIVVNEELGKNDNDAKSHDMDETSAQTCKNEISFPCDGAYLEKDGNGAEGAYLERDGNDANQDGSSFNGSILEREPAILDVHIIDPNSTSCSHGSEKVTKPVLMNPATHRFRNFGVQPEASCLRKNSNSHPGTSMRGQAVIPRSMSDMQSLSDKSQGKILSDMRRNSLSAVDYERIKLESEVGCLRERLKMVQVEREKLSFSVEHREREKLHLQILDDIARQLREIRHLTEPGKAVRQASLPPSSSKVSSKKRRCRSASLGLHGSS